MNGKFSLFGGDRLLDGFEIFVDGEIRKWRRDERRLAEQRTIKHQLMARKSCVVDDRSYRIARQFPASVAAQLDWSLIPVGRHT
jgi:hypothetical protein